MLKFLGSTSRLRLSSVLVGKHNHIQNVTRLISSTAPNDAPLDRKPVFPPVAPMVNFDTHKVVQRLEDHGFTSKQSEAILEVLTSAMHESLNTQTAVLATKSEHVELKAALSEKVFNSTLKFDIAQRHMKEILERDMNNLKQEIRTLENNDFNVIRQEINSLERKLLLQKQAGDERFSLFIVDIERVEKRVLQYAIGFAGTISAIGLGVARLFM